MTALFFVIWITLTSCATNPICLFNCGDKDTNIYNSNPPLGETK